jgi:hypothetical protein
MLHCNRAGWLTTVHVKGDNNVMADIASRPAKAQKLFCAPTPLSDRDFLASFDTTFPLPDQQMWKFAEILPWVRLCIFETLRGKRLVLQQWMGPNARATGVRGQRIVNCTKVSSVANPWTRTPWTGSSRLLSPCGKESTVLEIRSRFNQSSGLSGTLPKSLFWTDIPTHNAPPQRSIPSTSQLHG